MAAGLKVTYGCREELILIDAFRYLFHDNRGDSMGKRLVLSCMLLVMLVGMVNIRAEAKASDTPKKDYANIVLFAHFSGENAQEDAAFFANKENRDKIISYYNGSHGRSMTNYLKTVSYGKFQIHNIFPQDDGEKITSYGLSMSEKDAQSSNIDSRIIEEIINSIPGIKDQTIDYDNDGIIDNLTVVMKGTPPSGSTSSVPTLVSHKSDFPDSNVKWSKKGIGTYNMLSTDKILDQESGVIIHEFLHSLGYPDLYRGNIKDPNETCEEPVFIWDIMASATYRVAYPLAYLRMKYTNWLDIETVTESKSLTLDTQNKADGNQAYILKSPLNEHELFVVEYRKAGERYTADNQYNNDSLDTALRDDSYSGVIVYRVNTTVTGLSNYYGQTGVYVFRPQKGQNGYVEGNERETVMKAALSDKASKENKRTSIGHEDLSKKLTDGALTFSNGTNSGIVINNVKRQGDQMTLDVSIPEASDFDLWKDTGFANSNSSGSNKSTAITTCDGVQYLITYNPVTSNSGNFQLYVYKEKGWIALGDVISVNSTLVDNKIFSYNSELYLAYLTTEQKIYIKKCSKNGGWTNILSIDNVSGSDFDIKETTNGIYTTYLLNGNKAILGKVENDKCIQVGEYYVIETPFLGQPQLCELNGKIYVSVRDVSENSVIKIFRYDSNSIFTRVDENSLFGSTYDIAALDGKLYVSRGPKLNITSYNGKEWKIGKDSDISAYEPTMIITQGNLYLLVSDPNVGSGSSADIDERDNTKVYQYDIDNDEYIQEGIDVDSPGRNLSLTSSENKLFISYVRSLDNKIVVKTKNTANELLSLTIVPPKKTSYFKGDETDLSGISVTANYSRGSRELASGTYKITGFDTKTTGDKIATVTYGGKQGIFPYEVVNRHQHQFTDWKEIESVCENGIYRQRICTSCGFKETDGVNETNHDWEQEAVFEQNVTCTQDGSKSIHCKKCGATKNSIIVYALGHKFGNYVSDKNGTCIKDGTKTAKCERCNEKVTITDPGSKTAHNYKTTVNKATVSQNGSIVTACSACKVKKSSTVIYYPKTIALSGVKYTYNGKQRTPSVIVKDSKGGVIGASNYMVYYPGGRKAPGQYTVNITFRGNYSGTVQKSYQIIPKGTNLSKLSAGRKKLTVKWKKQTKEISGYQIQYSLKKNFKSGTKAVNVSKKKTSAKISKLKSKKKYYVRIRTYKTVKINGKSKKLYSGWSKSKVVKVK